MTLTEDRRTPTMEEWRLCREVYRYDGARIWWTARNALLDGRRPCDSEPDDVLAVLSMLADGAFV